MASSSKGNPSLGASALAAYFENAMFDAFGLIAGNADKIDHSI
jgi:hypothetical protein